MVLGGCGGAGAAVVEDAVVMELAAAEGEDSVVTVNCPDQAGLGCDLCRTILEFGLRITRGGEQRLPIRPPSFRFRRRRRRPNSSSFRLLLPSAAVLEGACACRAHRLAESGISGLRGFINFYTGFWISSRDWGGFLLFSPLFFFSPPACVCEL